MINDFIKKHKKLLTSYNGKYPLRVYYSHSSIKSILISCIVACAIVCLCVLLFHNGALTVRFVVEMCLLVCLLTIFIASHLLLREANSFIEPIENVTSAVQKVAEGDFTVQIENSKFTDSIVEFDALIESFNKMSSELNGMDYMRKDFMSNVSHEIKTPIAAITGFSEILQDETLPEADRIEYLKLVNDEASRLARLCDSMLRMSRLDNQSIIVENEEFDLSEQIRKCVILMDEKWEAKEPEFDIDLDDIKIVSSPDLLYQVWINLLDNAIKYSSDKCTISVIGRKQDNSVVIHIKDNGIGISKDKINHIYDKFYQCDTSHKKEGNGLGLSIVKRILELLNGTIECQSVPGNGTCFTVNLPF